MGVAGELVAGLDAVAQVCFIVDDQVRLAVTGGRTDAR
jgi:hypothetical protein